MNPKLAKSIKVYRTLSKKVRYSPEMTRTPEFRTAVNYRRSLDEEFGRQAVREALNV